MPSSLALLPAPSPDFLASLSHEIRTPLNGVLGMARQLSKTRLDAHQQELLRVLNTSGQHLLGVINEVLEMAHTAGANRAVARPPAPSLAPPANASAPANHGTGALVGLRVLLVEDNEINREVARFLLEEWGVLLDEAVDGAQGLHMLSQHDYDVALMDIQMPVLDGVEVTRAVRRLAHPERARIPILALTANAFREDNERYRAAGMNDTLAKPLNEHELYAKLEALRPAPRGTAPYNLSKLRAMAHGREAFVTKIICSFLANMPASLAQLQAAAAAGHWGRVAEIAHHIKPSLEMLGVPGTAPLVAGLAKAPVTPLAAPAEWPALAAQLVALVERALATIAAELPEA